ncbi:unnamed protein product [Onchocerca ochengi]|uniref:NtCtMGAM_N domain-containing protein n=1 Tax=Onchocerca ochengi TaxID=42157 RepID=A0A182EMY7_ONCOC|nr:unnamed protein product [Onchocerca ochengi]
MSSLLQRFDYGKVGARIPLIANYYEIKINREIYVHRYEVIIKDPTKDRRLDRSISNKYYPFDRSIYIISDQNRKWKVPIGGEIEAWTGLHGSVKINSVEHALFNADVSSCAFSKIRINLIDFFLEILNEFRGRRPSEYTVDELRQTNRIAMNDS